MNYTQTVSCGARKIIIQPSQDREKYNIVKNV